ncbi:MAG: ABC transporter permease [Anaerolineae bacterium]
MSHPRTASNSVTQEATLRRPYLMLVERRDITLLLTIAIMVFAFSRITPHFWTAMNLGTLGLAVAFNGIVVIGVTLLMIAGYNDLAVGSTYGFCAIAVGLLISKGFPVAPGILIGLLLGAGIGCINAILVIRYNLPPLLATLGTQSVIRGALWLISGGHSIVGLPDSFSRLGQNKLLNLQWPIYIMLIFVIIFDFLLRRSTFLRQLYYIGVNKASARTSGIPVIRVISVIYIITAVLAAIAGILDGARVGAVYVMSGTGLEFQVITAAVIGGTPLTGGKGTILGSLLGVIVMAMLTNVLNLVGVNMYWQNIMVGVILVAVVALDRIVTPKEVR